MSIFVDTSALLALLNAADKNHAAAKRTWELVQNARETIYTHNYILVEVCALAQRRFGIEAVRVLVERLFPVIHVCWIDENRHKAAVNALLTASPRKMSFVDCVSFDVMRDFGLRSAFVFDKDFKEQGFEII